jgi:hypothetical protein
MPSSRTVSHVVSSDALDVFEAALRRIRGGSQIGEKLWIKDEMTMRQVRIRRARTYSQSINLHPI